jgi:hypothetical protein
MTINFALVGAREQAPLDSQPFHQWIFPDGEVRTEFHRMETGYLLRFPHLADFVISADGETVSCAPTPYATRETARHLYLNQVLPLVLSKSGKLVFHASAVEVAGVAVAFVAVSGRGKSSLAAMFARGGYRFLTDDGLIVEHDGTAFRVLPGHPSIRLWLDSEKALLAPGSKPAPSLSYTSKSRFLAGSAIPFCAQPRPFYRAYFLGNGSADSPEFHPMQASEAFVEWMKHSFLLDIEDQTLLASHFHQVAGMATQLIHYRFDYPRRFDAMAEIREAIIANLGLS